MLRRNAFTAGEKYFFFLSRMPYLLFGKYRSSEKTSNVFLSSLETANPLRMAAPSPEPRIFHRHKIVEGHHDTGLQPFFGERFSIKGSAEPVREKRTRGVCAICLRVETFRGRGDFSCGKSVSARSRRGCGTPSFRERSQRRQSRIRF